MYIHIIGQNNEYYLGITKDAKQNKSQYALFLIYSGII